MKALFLVGRPGHSTVIMESWPWEKTYFRFEDAANGDISQKDGELIQAVKDTAPGVVIYISVGLTQKQMDGSEPNKGIPYDETFRKCRDIAPTVFICCDGGDVGWEPLLLRYYNGGCFDSMVTIDGVLDWPLRDKKGCFVGLNPWPWPQDLPIPPLADRSVDFGFHGAIGAGTRRDKMCQELARTAGLSVHSREDLGSPGCMPYRDYCNQLSKFKLALNMAWSGNETCLHVKGRVLEYGFAGCCLLENRFSWTKEWFTPQEDYLEYETAEGVAKQARWLLNNLDIAQTMANNLRRKVNEKYNAEKFWSSVLGKVGIKTS